MASSQEHERSMLDALAVSDANMNTGLGTPVRKIISAVATEMARYSIDVNTTQTLYALDAVSGTELDYLVGQFGFTRQEAKAAKGTVRIKRDNGDEVMPIAYGSQFMKPATATSPAILFQTTTYQELGVGVLSAEIAVIAVTPGSIGNVPANTITYTGVYNTYITVTNENPTHGGRDAESDADLRQRFLNTVFRNVSGTRDQYLGLAYAHEDVRRANIIGQESRYSEIVMVENNGGDFTVHPTAELLAMDVAAPIDLEKRLWIRRTESNSLIEPTLYHVDDAQDPFVIEFGGNEVEQAVYIDGIDSPYALTYTPILGNGITVTNQSTGDVIPSSYYTFSPENAMITFSNASLDNTFVVLHYSQVAVHDGEYITIEFDYRSVHNRSGLKTVDVYIDGESPQLVSDIQFLDFSKTLGSVESEWQRKNGDAPTSSDDNHLYLILSRQPLISSPGTINVGTSTILKEGVHYNVLYDVSVNAGSGYGIDAIELIGEVRDVAGEQRFVFANDESVALTNGTPLNVPYYYNKDVEQVQTLLQAQSVMTMDTLTHSPKKRIFSIALDVMYSARPKNNISAAITSALETWASGLSFGSVVQISDIETVVANVVGVDNVKLNQNQQTGGMKEYAIDGETIIDTKFTDFQLAQNEIFVLHSVIINDRSQQNW